LCLPHENGRHQGNGKQPQKKQASIAATICVQPDANANYIPSAFLAQRSWSARSERVGGRATSYISNMQHAICFAVRRLQQQGRLMCS
jgi:hypothetical protein